MAVEKEIKLKSKVKTTEKINPEIDNLLMEMSKLSLGKMTTGEMKIKVEKVNNVITKDEFIITSVLDEQQKVLANKVNEYAHATLKGVADGTIKVQFETVLKIG